MRKLLTAILAAVLCFTSTPVLAQSATPTVRYNVYSLPDNSTTSPLTDQYGRLQVSDTAYKTLGQPAANINAFPVTKTSALASSLTIGGGFTSYVSYLEVVSGASAGFVMVFPGNSVPADGAVTPSLCFNLAANSTFVMPPVSGPYPMYFSGGAVIVFSTTGCFTKTASATAFIAASFYS